MIEAQPFIDGLALRGYSTKPFPIFENDSIVLIISGIGKANAAMACTCMILIHQPLKVCNLGAAGATSIKSPLGECLHISKIIEPDRPGIRSHRPHEHLTATLDGFETAVLATHDRPITSVEDRRALSVHAELIDMEAASIAQACRRLGTPCYIFKFVSDTPAHTGTGSIEKNIGLLGDSFYRYIRDRVLDILFRAV